MSPSRHPLVTCGLLLALVAVISGYVEKPGPKYPPTVGYPWPMPKEWRKSSTVYSVDGEEFSFRVVDNTCDILQDALTRYKKIVTQLARNRPTRGRYTRRRNLGRNSSVNEVKGSVNTLSVHLEQPCEARPYMGMNETYELTVDEHPLLLSSSIWGILRGLETFSQLLVHSGTNHTLLVNQTSIRDSPRFPHRGLLVDTARHYIHPLTLQKILDGMSWNKLNVLHWHIVDDQSFPYVSKAFPELSRRGAFHPNLVYTPVDVQRTIEYARLRGIRVMVEFDTPGHTRALGEAHPEVLTQCYGQYAGFLGPVDPTKNSTFDFMRTMFTELRQVFPDSFVHLGADEVGYECWATSPDIRRYMEQRGYTKFDQLQSEYVEKIHEIVNTLNASSMVWQEAFESGLALRADTVVHVWIDRGAMDLMRRITAAGYRALLSAGWYLDHLQFASDFPNMYNNDPLNFHGRQSEKDLVIGGEACMWSEMVDDTSILPRIFPRVSAAAEKLWSHSFNLDEALHRIEEHACRMKKRGLATQPPNGPGFCI